MVASMTDAERGIGTQAWRVVDLVNWILGTPLSEHEKLVKIAEAVVAYDHQDSDDRLDRIAREVGLPGR